MYTIGTSALQYIVSKLDPVADAVIIEGIKDKMVAFVGTAGNRTGDGLDPDVSTHPATIISPMCVFFQTPNGIDAYTMPPTIVSITVWVPDPQTDFPQTWHNIGTLDPDLIPSTILPAGGLANVVMALPRGDEIDMYTHGFHIDGTLFYAKDINSLFIYDSYVGDYVKISGTDPNPIGTIRMYPEAMTLLADYLRCDGSLKSQIVYPQLYALCGNTFDDALEPTPAGEFRLPNYSNFIIRFKG
jgi:hypothetical protein